MGVLREKVKEEGKTPASHLLPQHPHHLLLLPPLRGLHSPLKEPGQLNPLLLHPTHHLGQPKAKAV